MKTAEQIRNEINELAEDALISTNSGTFSAEECCRKCGCGDPVFGTCAVYERLDGVRYTTGPGADDAPGYMRQIKHDSAVARRAMIRSLDAELKAMRVYPLACFGGAK